MISLYGPPLGFVTMLIILIVCYEAWADNTGRPWTITEGIRAVSQKFPWFAVLVLLLNGFFLCHCFGKALRITE